MTTNIERQFFETFGIEPIGCNDNENCTGTLDCRTQCPNAKYPQITDRILLELENIIHREYNVLIYEHFMDSIRVRAIPVNDSELGCDSAYYAVTAEGEDKREALLKLATDYNIANAIKQQVQSLFKEG